MFRDPSLWRWLREEYFPAVIDKSVGKFKIWLPGCVSGQNYFRSLFCFQNPECLKKFILQPVALSNKSIELIRNGCYDLKKLEVSEEKLQTI